MGGRGAGRMNSRMANEPQAQRHGARQRRPHDDEPVTSASAVASAEGRFPPARDRATTRWRARALGWGQKDMRPKPKRSRYQQLSRIAMRPRTPKTHSRWTLRTTPSTQVRQNPKPEWLPPNRTCPDRWGSCSVFLQGLPRFPSRTPQTNPTQAIRQENRSSVAPWHLQRLGEPPNLWPKSNP